MCFSLLNIQLSTLNSATKFPQYGVGYLSIQRLALANVAALSQRIKKGDIGLDHYGISRSKFLNHSAYLPAVAKATNSDSIVKLVMQVCFLDAQEIAPPQSRNTQLLVDELSSVLLIQH
ncbi:hypothetical protein Tco_1472345 [Tanacetum coccineum]